MLRDQKWIWYAIHILDAINKGANTIQSIVEMVNGGSPSYLAKVVAILRHNGLISRDYQLVRPLSQIMLADLAVLTNTQNRDKLTTIMAEAILGSLNIPISVVLEQV